MSQSYYQIAVKCRTCGEISHFISQKESLRTAIEALEKIRKIDGDDLGAACAIIADEALKKIGVKK